MPNILSILAKTKSPNFQLFRRAYIYNLTSEFITNWIYQEIAGIKEMVIEREIKLEVIISFGDGNINASLSTDTNHLKHFWISNIDRIRKKTSNFLLGKKIIENPSNFQIS